MSVDVRPVRTLLGRRRFVDFPFRLFRHDPDWVPPLRFSVYDRLSPRNPANDHQQTALWMAYRRGRPVARIGACVDRLFNEFQGLSWAWIGFFESFDDPEAATALFTTAWDWARARGATEAVGPASFTTNDECGLLVEGFEHPPMILTPQNPPYYERLFVKAGWEPAMDLWGWYIPKTGDLSDRQRRIIARLKEKGDIRVRSMRKDDFNAEVDRFFEVYHSAWARNWGFAPMTEREVKHLAKNLKQVLDPELALVAEKSSGEAVGVVLILPDLNEAMRDIRSGRLLPFGWLPLLRAPKTTTGARIFALGVKSETQSRALGPLLYAEIIDRLKYHPRISRVEASWILATNNRMNAPIGAWGSERYKTWRMYRRAL